MLYENFDILTGIGQCEILCDSVGSLLIVRSYEAKAFPCLEYFCFLAGVGFVLNSSYRSFMINSQL